MALFWPRCKAQLSVVLDGRGAPNSAPLLLPVAPRNCSVSRNGYHEADTWSMEIDTRLLPFDPDSIYSMEARIFMWDSAGNDSENFNWSIDKYEMIRGLLDDDDGVMVGEDNSVKLSGRDYTGVLIDQLWNPKHTVDPGRPLDQTIQEIADQAAPDNTRSRFDVVWRAEGDPPTFGHLIGRSHRTQKKSWIKPGKNYWEIIYDIAVSHGYVAYVTVEGIPLRPTIVITDAPTQTSESLKSAPRLAYGKHLTKLSVKRKFAHEKVPQIVITAWNPIKKEEVTVTYPEKRNVTTDALGRIRGGDTGSVAVAKDDQEFVPPPKGIYDRDTLLRFARARFFYRGRAETEYTFNTAFLSVTREEERDIGVNVKDDFDLLRLQPGNAVGVKFDPFNREHLRTLSVGERVEHFVALGYQAGLSAFLANNLEALSAFEQPYYFENGKFDFDIDDGMDIEIKGMNFASEVREVSFTRTSDVTPAGVAG